MELLKGKSEQAQASCHHPKGVSSKSRPSKGPWDVMSLLEGGKGRKGGERDRTSSARPMSVMYRVGVHSALKRYDPAQAGQPPRSPLLLSF